MPPGNLSAYEHRRGPVLSTPSVARRDDPAGTAGEVVGGRYELCEVLGAGGTATVFRALDRRLGNRSVALKLLHGSACGEPSSVAAFRREARIAAGLAHRNIAAVLDRGTCEGCEFIAFEYVAGGNLDQLVRDRGCLPWERAVGLARDVGLALAAVHARGVRHGRVTLDNVVAGDGPARLIDFGHASEATADGAGGSEEEDLRGLGLLLVALLTGDAGAWSRESGDRALEAVPPAPRRHLAEALDRVLAARPGASECALREFCDALAAALAAQAQGMHDEETVVLRQVPPGAKAGNRTEYRKRRYVIPVAALAVCAAAVLAGITLPGGSRSQRIVEPAGASAAAAGAVPVRAIAAYDPPPGDGVENARRSALASDGDPGTAWSTEWYASTRFGGLKAGVGLVLDAGAPVRLRGLVVRTDTPGFTALLKSGAGRSGPFEPISQPRVIAARTAIAISDARPHRFYLLWITSLAPGTGPRFTAHVSEVGPG